MKPTARKNIAHSVRDRLFKLAKARDRGPYDGLTVIPR